VRLRRSIAFWPKGSSVYTAILNAARVHGRPMMVIAIKTAAIIQPAAIHRPPNMIHSSEAGTSGTSPVWASRHSRHSSQSPITRLIVSFASWLA
jgi:hypothetical protein